MSMCPTLCVHVAYYLLSHTMGGGGGGGVLPFHFWGDFAQISNKAPGMVQDACGLQVVPSHFAFYLTGFHVLFSVLLSFHLFFISSFVFQHCLEHMQFTRFCPPQTGLICMKKRLDFEHTKEKHETQHVSEGKALIT